MDNSHSSFVDWKVAWEAVGGNEQLLVELIEIYFEEYPKLHEAIRQAIADAEAPTLRRAAHTMKGCLRYFGDTTAGRLALQLEEMGAEQSLEGAEQAFEQLGVEASRLGPELQDYLASHRTSDA